ncbi:MAG: restriction endonuclease subunit S [Treponema sp.]|uniref:restriction endonuclease subunit S n=1 Tax=Treponema sp. TaxID=166 RepID=UPI00298DAEB7|nr:restriction endonuclease subunit S [Treponema sp.]MCQ2601385.1 restriction endonuclease subunit S [Treponema sp.]
MRDEWEKVTLQDIVKIISGNTPSKENINFWNGEFSWISAKDMKSKYLSNSMLKLTKSGFDIANKAPVNSLVVLTRGMTLHNDIPICLVNKQLAFNQDVKCLIPNENVSSEYLYYYLQNSKSDLLKLVDSAGNGTGRLDSEILKNMDIYLPCLKEQINISETLSIWDSAIEKTEKLITLEKKRLAAFAVKLFSGKTRFTTKNRYLNEILKEKSELSTGLEEVFSVSVHKGLVNQIEHLGRSFAAKNTDNYSLVKFGHLVYTKSPTGDFPYGIVKQSSIKKDVIVSPLYGIYEPESFEIGLIVEFFFESPIRCKNYLYPLIQKGAKNTISISNQDFLKGRICFPENKKDINKIAEFIQMSKGYISLLNSQLEQYKLQKQGLMLKLLTGEWRVK